MYTTKTVKFKVKTCKLILGSTKVEVEDNEDIKQRKKEI